MDSGADKIIDLSRLVSWRAVEAHVVEDPDCGGHTIWLARAILA